MPCRHLQSQIPLYAGRDLEPAEHVRIDSHVRECPECQRNAAAFSQGIERMRSYGRDLSRTHAVPSLWEGVSRRLPVRD